MNSKREIKKARIIETLKKEEVKPVLEHGSRIEEVYHICDVFLEDIDKSEFEILFIEIIKEEDFKVSKDLKF